MANCVFNLSLGVKKNVLIPLIIPSPKIGFYPIITPIIIFD